MGEGANPRRGLLDTEDAAGPRDEAGEVDQVVFTGDMDPGKLLSFYSFLDSFFVSFPLLDSFDNALH